MTDAERDVRFEQSLAEWVRAALARGIRSFPNLVKSLPGAYPADVARTIERIRGEMPIACLNGPVPTPRHSPIQSGWPIEHPLDFDWRFTADAAQLLLSRCPDSDTVAFLGAPSLAREAAARGRRSGVMLLDRNPAIVEALRARCEGFTSVCTDLVWGGLVEEGHAAVAVADPPWYPEHTTAFLWAASRLSRLGGRVLLSLPPEGTRPGILCEREGVIGSASSFGLRLESIESGVLAYRMPLFERNALAAAGVPPVSDDWRRGDLATFLVAAKNAVDRPAVSREPDDWGEESFGDVRIKFRSCSTARFQDPTLSHVVPGDMLTSVSRRHPARGEVDVWTSGNRVYRCSAPGVFRVIVSALARQEDTERAVAAAIQKELTAPEVALVRKAAYQAADLLRREERELADYGHQSHERDLAEAV